MTEGEGVKDSIEVEKISASPAMLRLADSILTLDREEMARILAAYLLFRSRGKSTRELVTFLMTRDPRSGIRIGLKVVPPLVIGILSDAEFRALVLSMLKGDATAHARGRLGGIQREQRIPSDKTSAS